MGGPQAARVTDSVFEEMDLGTGLVRREWHSVDHVALSALLQLGRARKREWPFDYFHLNSIDQLAGGTTLISARNTWALYQLNTQTGQVLASIGGSSSTSSRAGARRPPSSTTRHAAQRQHQLFDNGGVPKVHPQSRGIVLSVNPQPGPTASWRVRAPRRADCRQPGQPAGAVQRRRASSDGARSPTSPSSARAASCCTTPTCTAPTSHTAPTASRGTARRRVPPRSPRRPRPPAVR